MNPARRSARRRRAGGALTAGLLAALLLLATHYARQTGQTPSAPESAPTVATTPSTPPSSTLVLTAIEVGDGDSFRARGPDGTALRVRIVGIDAPELTQPYGPEARTELARLLDRPGVEALVTGTDRHNRLLATVEVVDAARRERSDVGATMLSAGLAWWYRRAEIDRGQAMRYQLTEAQARADRRGLWREAQPTAPWDHRRRARAEGAR